MNSQGKYWCWTLNKADDGSWADENGNIDTPSDLEEYKTQRTIVTIVYTVAQTEKGEEGRQHVQGYVEFDKEVRFAWLKSKFNKRIHWERRKGSAKQAADYCKKEETRDPEGVAWEKGMISNTEQGKRNDLHLVADEVMQGKSLKQIAGDYPVQVIKFHRGIQSLIDLTMMQPADKPKRVIILYGAPGTGKSSFARKFLEDDGGSFYCPAMNNAGVVSFESYADQEWLWLDDFASGALTAQALKLICDRYPTQLPGRGSSKWAQHRGVLITSNYPIEAWFKEQVEATAIRRRCEQIWICEKDMWKYDGGLSKQPAYKPNPMKEYMK